MKTQTQTWTIGLAFVAIIAVVAIFTLGGKEDLSTTGQIVDDVTGETIGPWANTLVPYKLIVSDEFSGVDVAASAKVYDEMPEDWGNARGTFDDAKDYTIYTASAGVVTVNKEYPGKYYVVMTEGSYNTEFIEMIIPDGTNRGDISDYSSSPDSKAAEMTLLGTTTDEDFAFTLVNDSSAELQDTLLLKVAENTEFRGWKVIVSDEEGFSYDTDGDGIYDEGISSFTITVGQDSFELFNPNKGIDEFDSNDEFTFLIEGLEIADKANLVIDVEVEGITGDYVGANDEAWGEGEGVLSYVKIYDAESNLFATVDVAA